jgi:hypothetical protein
MGVPLDLQRKCEQRWAARFARPAPSAAPKGHQPESQNHAELSALDQLVTITELSALDQLMTILDGRRGH